MINPLAYHAYGGSWQQLADKADALHRMIQAREVDKHSAASPINDDKMSELDSAVQEVMEAWAQFEQCHGNLTGAGAQLADAMKRSVR